MNIETEFNNAVNEWITHCRTDSVQFSSSTEPVRNCGAYRKIVSMGYDVLPLIRKLYDLNEPNDLATSIVQGHGLVAVVKEIMGNDFSIPKEIQGRISAVEEYTKRWLDLNIPKYLPK